MATGRHRRYKPGRRAQLRLQGAGALLRRFGRPGLDRRQVLLVFSMTCVGALLNGQYTIRAFLVPVIGPALDGEHPHGYGVTRMGCG